MKDDYEIRDLEAEFETRATESGDGMTFSGWAIRYNQPSLPLPFIEQFEPGAFTRSLKSRNDIRMYMNHSDLHVLASTRAKTLRLEDRPEGLWVEADLPPTTYGNDLRILMERGDVHTQSIGFTAVRDAWSADGSARTVSEARLHESSIVTSIAAYPQSTAMVRNLRQIAARTATDVSALSEAFAALEAGEELNEEQADVLRAVVDKSGPEVQAALPTVPLALLLKQLDLKAKDL